MPPVLVPAPLTPPVLVPVLPPVAGTLPPVEGPAPPELEPPLGLLLAAPGEDSDALHDQPKTTSTLGKRKRTKLGVTQPSLRV